MIGNALDVASKRKKPSEPSRTYRSTARTASDATDAIKAFGARVRDLRLAAGLSQEAAAEAAGLGARHWQLVEAGGTNPTIATCVAVARALDVSLAHLFTDD